MIIELTGKRFGKWVVLGLAPLPPIKKKKGSHRYWRCRCECGNIGIVATNKLNGGLSTKCIHCANKTHGLSRTPIGKIIVKARDHMIERCYDSKYKGYHCYGGRGITVCDEWLDNPSSFYDWCLANGFQEGLTLDRIDNDKGYSPDNCRWVSIKEQARNRRNNVMLTHNGETMCISAWAEKLGMSIGSFCYRIKKGWSIQDVLNILTEKQKAKE